MHVTADVERDGDWWIVSVREVPGALTQARSIDEVPSQAADAVATLLEIPSDAVEVTVEMDPVSR